MKQRPPSLPLALCLLPLAFAACSSPAPEPSDAHAAVVTSAPVLGVPGGQDAADHGCNVVLRSVSRVPGNTGGYQTHCVPGSNCWYVWEGLLEVSAEAVDLGASPVVLFQSGSDQTWWKVEATPVQSGDGQHLYSFRLDEHTVPDGMSMTSLMQTKLLLAPAIIMPDESRLFDHNRNPGDFDNYVLDANDTWSIANDASVCPSTTQRSEIHFRSDWSNVQQGALVAGGSVTIDYDLQRLPQCFGSLYEGSPSWNTEAHARFLPGGEVVSGPVSEFAYVDGVGNQVVSIPWELAIPSNADRVEFWFETGGSACDTAWDSNFEANFSFPVQASGVQASVVWAGDGGAVIARGFCEGSESQGIPASIVLDSWALTRAECMWVDIDVYAPGVTDRNDAHPEWLEAQAVFSRDGSAPEHGWLQFVGRVGHNYRYRWQLREANDFMVTPWDRIDYGFRFSVDGNTWFEEGATRTIDRGADWCPATYWGSEKCP